MKFFIKYSLLLSLLMLSSRTLATTTLSPQAQVSLLTCDEGDDLYTLFGHSAIRIRDISNGLDLTYNWGMFDYSDPNFYSKFVKGKLDYYMDEQSFDYFMYEYQYTKRNVREQILLLSQDQKQRLYEALLENYKPENRTYKYDFFYDNCSTRVRDMIVSIMGENLKVSSVEDADQFTFREIIALRLQKMPWINAGIDLILGSQLDVKVDNKNLMFLPIYLEQVLDQSKVIVDGAELNFVTQKHDLIKGNTRATNELPWYSPSAITWIVFVVIFLLSFFQVPFITNILKGLVLLLIGVFGIFIVFMLTTDHQTAQGNYNILWAHPLHLLFIIPLFSKKLFNKLNKVFLVMAIVPFALIIGYMVIPQQFNSAFVPLILTLALIYFRWYMNSKNINSQPTENG